MREIILDYLGRPRVITRVLIRQRQESEKDLKMLHCWFSGWRKRPKAKECRLLPETEKGEETDSPLEPPKETQLY